MKKTRREAWAPWLVLAAILLVWELVCRAFQVSDFIFPAPSAIEKETRQQYAVEPIGRVDAVPARFYAISVERRVKHPAVLAIVEAARRKVFG